MSFFDHVAQGIFSSSSASGGSRCGACATKDAKIAQQAQEIKALQAHILRVKNVAAAEEDKGAAGQLLDNPPIRQGMFEGMEKTGHKLKRIL